MKKIAVLLSLLLLTLGLVACQSSNDDSQTTTEVVQETAMESSTTETTDDSEITEDQNAEETATSQYPMTFVDKFGTTVTIESEPQKVISMSPEITEILFAIGAGNRVVGRSSYCDYPEQALSVADFGTLLDINVETVLVENPDVIFVSSMASEEAVTTLQSQGLVVVALDKDSTFEGTYEYMQEVGRILNLDENAQALVEETKTRIQAVVDRVAGLEQPTIYYVVYAGDGYDSTATGDTFINGIIELAGGDNVAKDGVGWSYTVENLVEKDPTIMVCSSSYDTKTKIEGLEGYKDLACVKEGRLYEVNENIFSRQGPRVAEAVEVLAEILHPVE